ncbi:MAG: radical SAM protein [Clostridia bacterium]|nr:radical SAM protein [Clostridia bacterium]
MKKHKNIPIFIPHLGCPNDCVFCNQRTISGTREFDISSVRPQIDRALSTIDGEQTEVQLAFFGGSFTGIDRADMLYLLGVGKEYIDRGKVASIRLSTRPDYISPEILDILKEHGVRSVELGIQSMSDRVLSACGRGHTAGQSRAACALIKEYGFELVGQMMTSLPFSSPEDDRNTAREICEMGADGARIYPTMTFRGTAMEGMMERGVYTPPSLEESVSIAADVFEIFVSRGVEVIRIGLAESDGLHADDGIVGGAYHPAMGELVVSEYYRRLIARKITGAADKTAGKRAVVYCSPGETSKVIGQNRNNKNFFNNEYNVKIEKVIEKKEILRYNCEIDIL